MNPPKEITEAAIALKNWFDSNGYKGWQFMGIADRDLIPTPVTTADLDRRIEEVSEQSARLKLIGEVIHDGKIIAECVHFFVDPQAQEIERLKVKNTIAENTIDELTPLIAISNDLRRQLEDAQSNIANLTGQIGGLETRLQLQDDYELLKQNLDAEIASFNLERELTKVLVTERNDARRKLDAAEMACAQMREAIDFKIQGKSAYGYLREQFPATEGHIPLRIYFIGLGSSMANPCGHNHVRRDHPAIVKAEKALQECSQLLRVAKTGTWQNHQDVCLEQCVEALTALQALKEGK